MPPSDSDLQAADARQREAKARMDEAIAALEKAETEWHEACLECDRLAELDGE